MRMDVCVCVCVCVCARVTNAVVPAGSASEPLGADLTVARGEAARRARIHTRRRLVRVHRAIVTRAGHRRLLTRWARNCTHKRDRCCEKT